MWHHFCIIQDFSKINKTTRIRVLPSLSGKHIKNLRSKFFRSGIREPVVHIGSDFTITKVIRNTNLEVPEGFIELPQQMQRHTIVPKQKPLTPKSNMAMNESRTL